MCSPSAGTLTRTLMMRVRTSASSCLGKPTRCTDCHFYVWLMPVADTLGWGRWQLGVSQLGAGLHRDNASGREAKRIRFSRRVTAVRHEFMTVM